MSDFEIPKWRLQIQDYYNLLSDRFENQYLAVPRVAGFKSDVKFQKYNMADTKWRPNFAKTYRHIQNLTFALQISSTNKNVH